jgi:WD40 repeat protein
MIVGSGRLVKCCLTDGSILKDYTSMLFDAKRPNRIPAEMWRVMGPNSEGKNQINDIAATSDHKWLFAACHKGWWAVLDLQQDECFSRQLFTPGQDGQHPRPTSISVSPEDKLLYMVTGTGTVESYDIQAAKTRELKSIANQCFVNITVDPGNQFVFIASQSGNLYKYDTG